jgi:hypothetical protein
MADPFIPQRNPPFDPDTYRPDPHRPVAWPDATMPDQPHPAPRDAAGGFGAGMLVALVFVTIAIMAAVLLGNDGADMATQPATAPPAATEGG